MATTYRVFYANNIMAGFSTPAFVPGEYKQVAFVEADDLEDLFRQMNVVNGDEIPVEMKIRSMSCGDVAVCQATEKIYFCAPTGWIEIEHPTAV